MRKLRFRKSKEFIFIVGFVGCGFLKRVLLLSVGGIFGGIKLFMVIFYELFVLNMFFYEIVKLVCGI